MYFLLRKQARKVNKFALHHARLKKIVNLCSRCKKIETLTRSMQLDWMNKGCNHPLEETTIVLTPMLLKHNLEAFLMQF